MFNRMHQLQQLERKANMQNYSHELQVTADKRVIEQEYNAKQEKDYELNQALNKKKEADMLNQQTLDSKKSMQNILAKEYENTIRQKRLKEMNDKQHQLNMGKAHNDKAAQELEYLKKAELEKKNMIKQILNNEKSSHDSIKRSYGGYADLGNQEARKQIEENEKIQAYKDYQFGQRYNNFKQFQTKIDQSYLQQVKQPEMERQSKINQMIKKGEMEIKAKAEMADIQKQNAHKNWSMSNRAMLEKQMIDKNTGKKAGETEYEVDMRERVAHENQVKEVEYFEKFKKKQNQNQYKEMLDNQLKVSKQRRMYGNMTGVEKSFNKDDLAAWKHYDQNTYALIPGLNSNKKPISSKVETEKILHKRDRSYEDEVHRMNKFGFTRDVTLAPSQSQTVKYAQSTRKMPDIQAFSQEPVNRKALNVSAKPNPIVDSPGSGYGAKTGTRDVPNRQLLSSGGHAKYPNHHLYGSYNPISGAFYSTETNINNKKVFKNAGNNIFF